MLRDLNKKKKQLHDLQAERTRQAFVLLSSCPHTPSLVSSGTIPLTVILKPDGGFYSQTEAELKEKLQDCLKKISEAGAAQRETDSEMRIRTMVEKLRKMFPGMFTHCDGYFSQRLKL